MRKKNRLLWYAFSVIALVFGAKLLVFTVPDNPELIEYSRANLQKTYQSSCVQSNASKPIDHHGELNLLVWNIYKQQQDNWKSALSQLSQQSDLLLLQEASLTSELKQFINNKSYLATLVRAFDVLDIAAGVVTLATEPAEQVCAYTAMEPWLGLPKSALISLYKLSNGSHLMVINIHSINFTFGTQDYIKQIVALTQQASEHQGPLIIAGDFNTWSDERSKQLKAIMQQLALQEVQFMPDQRMRFINGLPLDHIFYRGLDVKEAHSVIQNNASDHSPLQVSFSLKTQSLDPIM